MISLAEGDFVYIRNEGDGSEELFNEREDPDELKNLAGAEAMLPVLRRFRDHLAQAKARAPSVRDAGLRPESPPRRTSPKFSDTASDINLAPCGKPLNRVAGACPGEAASMPDRPLRILVIGAHPDDADIKAGGTAAKWCALGHVVRLVSLTNGQAGHQTMHGPQLARRRRAEAQAAGAVIGAAYEVFDQPDGELDDRLEFRHQMIRLIRSFRPDLVITHRSNDYHPDHRFAGLLVQDASYLLTVPAICPDVPHLASCPVILSFSDAFTKPCPFEPHIVVDIEDEFDRVVAMLHRHQSQFYEWLPYNGGFLEQVPREDSARADWLAERLRDASGRSPIGTATWSSGRTAGSKARVFA